jgi:hypothetical protein
MVRVSTDCSRRPAQSPVIFSPRGNSPQIRPVSSTFQKKIARNFRALAENRCGITGDISSPPPGGLIFPRMTRAQSVAHWSGIPSLSHRWMAALLRLSAMLVQNAASFLRMRLSRLPGECHADATPQTLPSATSSNPTQDPDPAATPSHSQDALMVSRPRSGRCRTTRAGSPAPATSWRAASRASSSHRSFRRKPGPRDRLDPCSSPKLQPKTRTSLQACLDSGSSP